MQILEQSMELVDNEVTMLVGSGALVSAKATRTIHLFFGNNYLILNSFYLIRLLKVYLGLCYEANGRESSDKPEGGVFRLT